jgi:hypothetical protein
MKKSAINILVEASLVGLVLILIFLFINAIIINQSSILKLFLSGFIFHLLCEVSGLNIVYAKHYSALLEKKIPSV